MAKESIELIDDERLELMELAASKQGLHSILELDSETLGILQSFEGNCIIYASCSMSILDDCLLVPI